MKTKPMIGVATALLAGTIFTFGAQKQNDVERQLKAAINTELVDGNLKAAIEQYKKVAATGNRPLAAEALLHMAECYQKLGDSEAPKIYDRLVREFADQKNVAEVARQRLGQNASAGQPALARRRIWNVGPNPGLLSVSGDGSVVLRRVNGDVVVHDVRTGAERQITDHRKGDQIKNPSYPSAATMSTDGKRIAIGWKTPDSGELRIMNADGSNEQTIYRNAELEWIGAMGWSPDGKQILVETSTHSKSGQIAWVSIADKSLRVLKTIPWGELGDTAVLSDDGRYIAYDRRSSASKNTTIFVIAADASRETAISDGSAREKVFGWMPGGHELLFATNRRGGRELWSMRIVEGKPSGANLVQGDLDSGSLPLGITKTGTLFYYQVAAVGEVNVASVDWNTGAISGVKKISGGLVPDRGADWSPDGRKVAFLAHHVNDFNNWFIAVRSTDGQESRDIAPPSGLGVAGTAGWSPDGNSYLVNGTTGNGAYHILVVDLKTGSFRRVVTPENESSQTIPPQWMPDGKSIIYTVIHRQGTSGYRFGLMIRDLESESEREVSLPPTAEPLNAFNFAVSPDGKQLAFARRASAVPEENPISVMPLSGGPARPIASFGWIEGWTPDSHRILYTGTGTLAGKRFSIPAEGGVAEEFLKVADPVRNFSMQPNGHQIAYNTNRQEWEVWVMDNLNAATHHAVKK